MPRYKFSMRIDSIDIPKNGRSGDKRIRNRFLLQLVAPAGTDHPSTTFSFRSDDGQPVPGDILRKALPFALAFKLQDYQQVFDEPLRIRAHFFQDTRRDWFQQLTGRFIELAFKAAFGDLAVAGVKVDRLLGLDESLKLSDDTYSQKLAASERDIDPSAISCSAGGSQERFVLRAAERVQHLKFPGPGQKPRHFTVANVGDTTATISATLKLDSAP